jgi:RNA-directed DNA polymerase
MRQKTETETTLQTGTTGEARSAGVRGTEAHAAKPEAESRAAGGPLMEAIVERDNLKKALAQVKRNKGAAGVDGMSVGALGPYLKEHWPTIRAQLLDGSYKPQPVRRVEIPKATGGTRLLGIPTVLDRPHRAGGVAGAAGGVGPDVLRDELRLPTEALGASGGGTGAKS